MPEEVLFEFERGMDRSEIADYLRAVADALDRGESLSLEAGGDSIELSPPARPTFEVKAERETDASGESAELGVEFELEWREGESGGADDGGDLRIG